MGDLTKTVEREFPFYNEETTAKVNEAYEAVNAASSLVRTVGKKVSIISEAVSEIKKELAESWQEGRKVSRQGEIDAEIYVIERAVTNLEGIFPKVEEDRFS